MKGDFTLPRLQEWSLTIRTWFQELLSNAHNGHVDTSSNLDKADSISHSTNTLGKGMNTIILPPAMGK